jgi:molybdenum cofactor cytidylyltransferase
MKISQALRFNQATTLALVGSGGKTTALFQLARQLSPPVIVSATSHLHISQINLADTHLMALKPEDLDALDDNLQGVILVTGPIAGERTQGLNTGTISRLGEFCSQRSLPLLIEADGSRMHPLKAPATNEPPIPDFARMVVVSAGLSALGKPLTAETVHHPEIFGTLSGLGSGEMITPDAIVRVLTHPQGGLKNIPPQARRIALLNQADTPGLMSLGRSIAEKLLPAYHTVLVASLQQELVNSVYERTSGIILAAGEARRFGRPKQLAEYNGHSFVRNCAMTALAGGLSPVVVVTGSYADQVEAEVMDLPVKIARNNNWLDGQGSSIRAGIDQLPADTGAVIFMLVDQPQVNPPLLRSLIELHTKDLAPIIAPLVQGQRANPVLFDRSTFEDLKAISGDTGGRALFQKFHVIYLPWHDEGLLIDVDTPGDLEKLVNNE